MSHLLPNKDEAKQDFLKRCRAENSMAQCSGFWNQARLTAFADDNIAHLRGDVRFLKAEPKGNEAETPRRFSMLGYTGKEIDWGFWGRFIISLDGIKAEKAKMPSLLDHYTNQRVGVIDKTEASDNGFIADGYFLKGTAAAEEVLNCADQDFPWQCSIGVRALQVLEIAEGETYEVNGQTVTGPIDVWLKSSVFEVSFCTFGADDDTAGISMTGPRKNKEVRMDARLKKWLVSLGLSAEATDEAAKAFLAKIEDAGIITVPTFEGDPEPGTTATLNNDLEGAKAAYAKAKAELAAAKAGFGAQQPGGEQPVIPTADPAPVATLSATDTLLLGQNAAQLGLSLDDLADGIKAGNTMAELTRQMFELAGKKNGPAAMGRVEMGADEADKFRLAAVHGLVARLGGRFEGDDKPAPGYEKFRFMPIHELARQCLSRMNVDASTLAPDQLAQKILELSAGAPTSTSDFKSIFMDVSNIRVLKSFQAIPQNWRPLVNIVPVSNFKKQYGVALKDAGDFREVKENGEYKETYLKDVQESFQIAKYGRIISLTFEMITDDDLSLFTKIPQKLGSSAAKVLNKIVWDMIISNPNMSDGYPLFYAGAGNLLDGCDLTSASLADSRAKMRTQKDENGDPLYVTPKYLVVPTTMETNAEILLRSTALPEANLSAGVHNPNAGKLEIISDPALDKEGARYLAGDPNQVETVDVGFLRGREEPEIFEHDSFKTDSISYKGRICFGGGPMGREGLQKTGKATG